MTTRETVRLQKGYMGLLYKFGQRALDGDTKKAMRLQYGWVRFIKQGNFTIALILDRDARTYAVGVSKRLPADTYSAQVGKNLALWRAFEDFFFGVRG